MEGTLGISNEEMENIPQTAQAAVVKGHFHNESLDDPVKESVGRLYVHPPNAKGVREVPSVHSFHLEHPLVSEGSPPAKMPSFDLPCSSSRSVPQGSSQGPTMTVLLILQPYSLTNHLILLRREETRSSFAIS